MLSLLSSQSGHNDRVWCVTWDRLGGKLVSCGADKAVHVFTVKSEDPDSTSFSVSNDDVIKHGHSRTIRFVTFSPCNNYLVTTSFDSTAIVWQYVDDEWEIHTTLEGHENEVKCAAWSQSGQFLATCSRDKSVWVWELDEDEDLQCCSILQAHSQDVKCVAFHPQVDMFVSCSYDDSINFHRYDLDDWIVTQTIESAHKGTVWSAVFDKTGTLLATSGHDGIIKIWRNDAPMNAILENKDKWRLLCQISDEAAEPVYSLDWCPLTNCLATACRDGSIRVYKPSSNLQNYIDAVRGMNATEQLAQRWMPLELTNPLLIERADSDRPETSKMCQESLFKQNRTVFSCDQSDVSSSSAISNTNQLMLSASMDLCETLPNAHDGCEVNSVKWNPKVAGLLSSAGDDNCVKLWILANWH